MVPHNPTLRELGDINRLIELAHAEICPPFLLPPAPNCEPHRIHSSDLHAGLESGRLILMERTEFNKMTAHHISLRRERDSARGWLFLIGLGAVFGAFGMLIVWAWGN